MSGWEKHLQTLKLPEGQPVRFWVMDESRFGLHSIVRHCWGLRGKRVIKSFQQKFDWDYVYGALDILSGEPVCCFVPTVSCDAVWEFLRQLVRTDSAAQHVVLWDGAGFHQPPDATQEEWADLNQVQVLKLPPYCPELNPVERLWDQVKDAICNRTFTTIEALREALTPVLAGFWNCPKRVKKLIGKSWLIQNANDSYPAILPIFN